MDLQPLLPSVVQVSRTFSGACLPGKSSSATVWGEPVSERFPSCGDLCIPQLGEFTSPLPNYTKNTVAPFSIVQFD